MKEKTVQIFLIAAIVCLSIFIACEQGDDDDEEDDESGDDCSDEPSFVPGEPYPSGDVWQPSSGTSWQWQLTGTVDLSFDVDMYDVDLFNTPDGTIDKLHDDGRVVICYFSAGSYETWRDDANQFPEESLGSVMEDWQDERWLDVRNEGVRSIMLGRLDLAMNKGCDGVEPDNVDGYSNSSGFDFSALDQIEYNRFIADEAHKRGLSVGLKNDTCQLDNLVDWYDWGLNEECYTYNECDVYDVFLNSDKAVFHVEYVDNWGDAGSKADKICGQNPKMDTIIKEWDLTANRLSCDEI